jgi:actin-related protein 6
MKADYMQCDPRETNLLLMEKPNCPRELQKNCDEIVFEQFEFTAYHRCIGTGCRYPFAYNIPSLRDAAN